MRISDWSSDVCSSDLILRLRRLVRPLSGQPGEPRALRVVAHAVEGRDVDRDPCFLQPMQPDQQGEHRFTGDPILAPRPSRSEEHTSELQSLMRISYAVFCLKNKKNTN